MSAKLGVREAQKAETRALLERAALQCFAEKGYGATQVADVARRAGVAHGTFYVHFPTKADLVDHLLAKFQATMVARLEDAWGRGEVSDPRALARRLAEVCLDHWASERELLAAFAERFGAASGLAVARDGLTPDVGSFLADRLRAFAAATGADLPDAELVAHGLLGLWTRVGLRFLFGAHPVARKAAVEVLAASSLGVLAAVLPALRPTAFPRSPHEPVDPVREALPAARPEGHVAPLPGERSARSRAPARRGPRAR